MAFVRKRGERYSVVYRVKDAEGKEHQRSGTYGIAKEANQRKKEIEYKVTAGVFEIPECKLLRELVEEYVHIYGEDKWSLSTYDGNVSLLNNYILPTIGDIPLADISNLFLEKMSMRIV